MGSLSPILSLLLLLASLSSAEIVPLVVGQPKSVTLDADTQFLWTRSADSFAFVVAGERYLNGPWFFNSDAPASAEFHDDYVLTNAQHRAFVHSPCAGELVSKEYDSATDVYASYATTEELVVTVTVYEVQTEQAFRSDHGKGVYNFQIPDCVRDWSVVFSTEGDYEQVDYVLHLDSSNLPWDDFSDVELDSWNKEEGLCGETDGPEVTSGDSGDVDLIAEDGVTVKFQQTVGAPYTSCQLIEAHVEISTSPAPIKWSPFPLTTPSMLIGGIIVAACLMGPLSPRKKSVRAGFFGGKRAGQGRTRQDVKGRDYHRVGAQQASTYKPPVLPS